MPLFLSRLAFFGSFTAPVAMPLMGLLAVLYQIALRVRKSILIPLKRELAITHQTERRCQQASERQDDEHGGSHLGVDLAVGHTGYGKTDNNEGQVHECQIRDNADDGLAIRFHSATGGVEERVDGADDADEQGAVTDGTQIFNAGQKGMAGLQIEDAEYE